MEKDKLIHLVQRAQKGDSEAMGTLFVEYRDVAYSIAMRETKSRTLSDDIVHETFIQAIQKIGDLQTPEAFPAWLKAIAYHQSTRHYKKKEIVHEILVNENEEGFSVFDVQEETNASFIPDEALDQKDFKETILSLIEDLPDVQRSALTMFYFEELPLKVIAQVQGVSVNTANTRLNRGRMAMKGSIESYEKKHGIQLHSVAFFPFFRWLLAGTEETMSSGSAATVAQNISTATGISIAATEAVAATATAATTSAAATASATVGIGAKIVAMPLVTKIIAGVLAVSIALGIPSLTLREEEPGSTESTTPVGTTEPPKIEQDDDEDYFLIDPFLSIEYICYIEESNSFVVRQTEDYQKEYSNGWVISNIDKVNDEGLYVRSAGSSNERNYGMFYVNEDSFDGTSVTVYFHMPDNVIMEYKNLGMSFSVTEKQFAVVKGEYVKDASRLNSLPFELETYAPNCRVFFWSDKKDSASEKENLLEYILGYGWSSETNTECIVKYNYYNLIETEAGEIITQRYGASLSKSQLFDDGEQFSSVDEYIEIYSTRWNYGVELFDDTQNPSERSENLVNTFSRTQQREINSFLSKFTSPEVLLWEFPTETDDGRFNLIFEFAFNYGNETSEIIDGKYYFVLTEDKVDDVLERYFGVSIEHGSIKVPEPYSSDAFFYENGKYYHIEAYGETYRYPFVVVDELYQNGDGTYEAYFTVYYAEDEYGTYGAYGGTVRDQGKCYELFPDEIKDYPEIVEYIKGTATLRGYTEDDGTESYQIITLKIG